MKFVVDVNLSPAWARLLEGAGHQAVHWQEVGPGNAEDEDIVAWAEREDAVVLTRDLDFGAYVVLAGRTKPSVMQVRAKRSNPERFGGLVLRAVRETAHKLSEGALVTIEFERIRVRLLAYPSE